MSERQDRLDEALKVVKETVRSMDQKRKNDLLDNLVNDVFDSFFYDADSKLESMIEVIENITGLDDLEEMLYE